MKSKQTINTPTCKVKPTTYHMGDDELLTNLEFECLFDEARTMAYVLNKIEQELQMAVISARECYDLEEQLLPKLCMYMYEALGYHKQKKYNVPMPIVDAKKAKIESEDHFDCIPVKDLGIVRK